MRLGSRFVELLIEVAYSPLARVLGISYQERLDGLVMGLGLGLFPWLFSRLDWAGMVVMSVWSLGCCSCEGSVAGAVNSNNPKPLTNLLPLILLLPLLLLLQDPCRRGVVPDDKCLLRGACTFAKNRS